MELHVVFETNDGTERYCCNNSESDFYKEIGKRLLGISVPNTIRVTVDEYPEKEISYEVKERGTYRKGGVSYPSMYVSETGDTVWEELEPSYDYRHVFLTCINPESNSYKYYEIKPSEEDFFTVTYGRMNEDLLTFTPSGRTTQDPYDSRLYWIRYYEKLSKGYIDNSDVYIANRSNRTLRRKSAAREDTEYRPKSLEDKLYHDLLEYSKNVVRENIMVTRMTTAQLERYGSLYYELCETRDLQEFNSKLMELYSVCPRKIGNVSSELANSTDSRKMILERENNILQAINAVFGIGKEEEEAKPAENPFESMDIELYAATYEQREHVMAHLYDDLKPQVRNIYRVIPKKQKERFDRYLEDNNISVVKELWHGSRNENWLSIIENSLLLYPDAVITGKMFGDGIYFASNIYKSLNYTSLAGSYWTGGKDSVGYMGLFATAYGDPLKVLDPDDYTEDDLKRLGKNCVHAEAGSSLRNDEIVFYNEDAVLLNYIVEFKTSFEE